MTKNHLLVRKVTVTALMAALGFVLMLIEISLPFIIPDFIKFDFSEVPPLIATFLEGPVAGIAVCLIKNLLKAIFLGNTGGIGELANFLMGCCLVLPAGLFFKRKKTGKSMVLGGLTGAGVMAILSLPINYFISYPVYAKFMPIDVILSMYQKLLPSVDSLLSCLLIFNLPFTLVKGVISVIIAYFISKRIISE